MSADYADDHARESENSGQGGAHGERCCQGGRHRQSRTDAQDLQRDGVVVEDGRRKMTQIATGHGWPSFFLKRSRNGPKPCSPSQNLTRFDTPMLERVAPLIASTSKG